MSLYVLAAASDWPISLGGPHGKRKEINWPFYGNLGLLDFVLRLRKEAPPVKEWNRIKVDSSDWIFLTCAPGEEAGETISKPLEKRGGRITFHTSESQLTWRHMRLLPFCRDV